MPRNFLIAMVALAAWGDDWRHPSKFERFSANKRYRLEVTPNMPATAHAVISARGPTGQYVRRASFALANKVSPVSAVVSNDGKFIATFDDWYAAGIGDTTVVIYRSNGSLVRKFSLADLLTPSDLNTLPRSTSSIRWGGEHFLNSRGQLVLRIVSNRKLPADKGAVFHELRIDLESGEPLEPNQNRLHGK